MGEAFDITHSLASEMVTQHVHTLDTGIEIEASIRIERGGDLDRLEPGSVVTIEGGDGRVWRLEVTRVEDDVVFIRNVDPEDSRLDH